MNTVLTVSVIAVFASVMGLLLQRSNKEIALLCSAGGAVLIFLYILPQTQALTETIGEIAEIEETAESLNILIKALGVVLTARIAVQLCKDAGENALAAGVDFAAKISVLLIALPLIEGLLQIIQEVLTL